MIHIRAVGTIPYPWVVVGLCTVGLASFNFVLLGFPALFPLIQEDFGASRAQLGLIVSGTLLGVLTSVLFMGWLADTIGVRRLLAITLSGLAVAVLLFSQVPSLILALPLAVLIGVAGAGTDPSVAKGVMEWVRPNARGVATGIVQTSVPIAGITTAAILPLLAEIFSWRIAVMFLAVPVVASTVVFVTLYRDKPAGGTAERTASPTGRIAAVFKNRQIWLAALCGTGLSGVHVVFWTYLILYLKEDLQMSAVVGGLILGTGHAGSLVGRVGWGLVSDFLLGGRQVPALGLVCLISVFLMAFMALLPSSAPLAAVGVLVFVAGAVVMGWPGLMVVLLAELGGPRLMGRAVGFGLIIGLMGAVAVPPLFGLVVDQTDSYSIGWWMMSGLAVLASVPLAILHAQGGRH